MSENNESLRKCVQKIEGELRSIVGDCIGKWFSIPRYDYEFEELVELLNCRRDLLDKMFVATSEEIERMEQVNNRLSDLTNKLFARTEELCHKMATTTYDPEFDNHVDVEGSLKFEMNDEDSILPMSNDNYYGSDFKLVFEIISSFICINTFVAKRLSFVTAIVRLITTTRIWIGTSCKLQIIQTMATPGMSRVSQQQTS